MFTAKNQVNKILGNKVEVFGQELYLRNLTLGSMRRLEPLLERLNGNSVVSTLTLDEVVNTIGDVFEILTERDYTFDRKSFEDNVDVEEVHLALPSMLEAAGLAQKKTS